MVDLPPAPSDDAVLFRRSPGRVVLFSAGFAAFGWGVGMAGVGLAIGAVFGAGWAAVRVAAPVGALGFVAFTLLYAGTQLRRSPWVRVSSGGLELGAPFTRAVLVPWAAVEAVRVSRTVGLTGIEVVPSDPALVSVQDTGGRGAILRVRPGGLGYQVDTSAFPRGGATLLAALRTHGVDI
ncbi:hypothetical protein [Dactylosporangium sp. CA-233914]|uniref:hypothetical protein n=1 Tax=Dactylosporangium sp. CA-233914 TaxID=3239934 RepID=UPI003D8BDDEB